MLWSDEQESNKSGLDDDKKLGNTFNGKSPSYVTTWLGIRQLTHPDERTSPSVLETSPANPSDSPPKSPLQIQEQNSTRPPCVSRLDLPETPRRKDRRWPLSWRPFWKEDRWGKIGAEVYERKALVINAAKDLQENGCSNPFKLAAADVFVEKAQLSLTSRANMLLAAGFVTACFAVLISARIGIYISEKSPLNILGLQTIRSCDPPPGIWSDIKYYALGLQPPCEAEEMNQQTSTAKSSKIDKEKIDEVQPSTVQLAQKGVAGSVLTIAILKTTTAGGFYAGIIYLLVVLSRAFFHESTVLYSRRHSLRFGRMFVYLMSDTMRREDLEAVFNWNKEFSTAFKDINADGIAKPAQTKVIEESLKQIKELLEHAKK